MLDDGLIDASYFIVMEHVQGERFPGTRGIVAWKELKPIVLQLLEALARVHLSGLFHQDLKPANVLVDREGNPTILDLGLAAGRALDTQLSSRAYTPAFAAPEQILRQHAGAPADLFSVGVMIFLALTGALPHPARRNPVNCTAYPAPPISALVPGIPPQDAAAIAQLLEINPFERLESALDAIKAFGGQLPPLLGGGGLDFLPRDQRVGPEALRVLFHGPDNFFHLREDAADELWRRTGGFADYIEDELGAWLRAGLVHWEDDALRIDRNTIDNLRGGRRIAVSSPSPPDDPSLQRAFAAIELGYPFVTEGFLADTLGIHDVPGVVRTLEDHRLIWRDRHGGFGCRPTVRPAQSVADEELRSLLDALLPTLREHDPALLNVLHILGVNREDLVSELSDSIQRMTQQDVRQNIAMIEAGIALAQLYDKIDEWKQLLLMYALLHLTNITQLSSSRVLYEFDRFPYKDSNTNHVIQLIKAYRLINSGQPSQARQLLKTVPPLKDERLDDLRLATEIKAIYFLTPVEVALHEEELFIHQIDSSSWANTEKKRAFLSIWKGNHRYRIGDYQAAVELHNQNSLHSLNPSTKLSSMLNEAVAYMEMLELQKAFERSLVIIDLSRKIRHTRYELLGTWIRRSTGYRMGKFPLPAPSLLASAALVGKYEKALFSLTESALSYRRGMFGLAQKMCSPGIENFKQPHVRALLKSLYIACGGCATQDDAEEIIRDVVESGKSDFIVQVIGLISARFYRSEWEAIAIRELYSRPVSQWYICLDVLSFQESLQEIQKAKT